MIVAVDEITSELRTIIEYLNAHTLDSVQVLALELAYSKDGDIELLIPEVYGIEAADRKARSSSGATWTPDRFSEAVEERTDGDVRRFIERLMKHGAENGHRPNYGVGAAPAMSYYYRIGSRTVPVWALYLYDYGPRASVRVGAVARVDEKQAARWVAALRQNPALAHALEGVTDETLNRYPELPVADLLTGSGAPQEWFLRPLMTFSRAAESVLPSAGAATLRENELEPDGATDPRGEQARGRPRVRCRSDHDR